jgi:ABC-type transport system substrate-binding protein
MAWWWRRIPVVLAMIVLLVGCTQPSPPASTQAQGAAQGAGSSPSSAPRTSEVALRIVIRDEPTSLDSRMYRTNEVQTFLNAGLSYHDEKNLVRPLLAARLPSRDDGSWVVNADGTMRTVYTLKPNLKWQDGEPLTAGDFAFAYQAYMDAAVPVLTRIPESFMSGVRAIDDTTLEITWKSTYVDANAMPDTALTPLPHPAAAPQGGGALPARQAGLRGQPVLDERGVRRRWSVPHQGMDAWPPSYRDGEPALCDGAAEGRRGTDPLPAGRQRDCRGVPGRRGRLLLVHGDQLCAGAHPP